MGSLAVIQPPQAPSFSMGDMERIATAIAKGGLFGSNDLNAVLTLCMLAQAENKHPALIMQNYHIIKGKPAKKADAMLVDFLASGGKVEWHTLTDECADATFSHPSGGSIRIDWTKARVAQAQLGGNDMHKKYPRQMLRARVISEGVRTVFPGATSGMYVPEEVEDFDEPRRPTPPTPPAQRARQIEPVRQIAKADDAAPFTRADGQEGYDIGGHDPETGEINDAPDLRLMVVKRIVDAIAAAETVDDLSAIGKAERLTVRSMPEEMQADIAAAEMARRVDLAGGE